MITAAPFSIKQTYVMDSNKEPIVEQPSIEMQRAYKSLTENTPTEVTIPNTNKKYLIKWLKYGQLNKLSKLLIRINNIDNKNASENVLDKANMIIGDSKLACKASAIYILNGFWTLHLKYWFLWRWFYYIKQYDYAQLLPILTEGKKKVPAMQFFGTTTLLIGAKDTLLQMTTMEAERILQGLNMGQLSQEQSTESSSSEQDTSSSDL
nr:MAG TPA: hypothetical protein [Caudoviricetes sp.]